MPFVSRITQGAPIMRAMRRYDIVTFDCYGTLIDWERGIADAFRDAARADGVELDRDAVLRAYAEHEPAAEAPRGCTPPRATSTTSCRRTRWESRTPGSTGAARRRWPAAYRRSVSSATSPRSPTRSPDRSEAPAQTERYLDRLIVRLAVAENHAPVEHH